jgi:hypothetical protein
LILSIGGIRLDKSRKALAVDVQLQDIWARIMTADIVVGLCPMHRFQRHQCCDDDFLANRCLGDDVPSWSDDPAATLRLAYPSLDPAHSKLTKGTGDIVWSQQGARRYHVACPLVREGPW